MNAILLIANRSSSENGVMQRASPAAACLWEPVVLDGLFNIIQSVVFARTPRR